MAKPVEGEVVTAMNKIDRANEASQKYLGGESFILRNCIDRMAGCLNSIAQNFVEIGRYALAVKHAVGHGEFQSIIKEHFEDQGLMSLRTIQQAMNVAEYYLALPKAERSSFMALGKTRQLMLASASDETDRNDYTLLGLTMADMKAMKIRDLQAEIEKLKDNAKKNRTQIFEGTEQLQAAKAEIRRLRDVRRVIDKDEAEVKRVLDGFKEVCFGAAEALLDKFDPRKMTPEGNAGLQAAFTEVLLFLEDRAMDVQKSIRDMIPLKEILNFKEPEEEQEAV